MVFLKTDSNAEVRIGFRPRKLHVIRKLDCIVYISPNMISELGILYITLYTHRDRLASFEFTFQPLDHRVFKDMKKSVISY